VENIFFVKFHSVPFSKALLPVVPESFMSRQKYVTYSRDSIQGISELQYARSTSDFVQCIII